MSLPRPCARAGLLAALVAALLALGTGIAAAHVTVSSADATAGGFGKVTFRVPDESDTASTVKIRIQLPTGTPFAAVSVQPVPGWTATMQTRRLNPPATDDDGKKITEAVSVVEFAAGAGGGIAPGQFQEFSLSLGTFPKTDRLVFNVLQDYSDGTQAAWIDPPTSGGTEPAHPAPVLTLTAATPAATLPAGQSEHSSTATWGLVVAIVALVVAVAAAALAWAGRRRTVAE